MPLDCGLRLGISCVSVWRVVWYLGCLVCFSLVLLLSVLWFGLGYLVLLVYVLGLLVSGGRIDKLLLVVLRSLVAGLWDYLWCVVDCRSGFVAFVWLGF